MSSKVPVGGALLSRTPRFVVVALAVWVVMALVVPVAADAGSGRGSTASGAGVPQITWAACGPQLECANVPVPLDWAHPHGPAIALRWPGTWPATPSSGSGRCSSTPAAPVNRGWAMSPNRGQALDAMTGGRFDIVGWDLRGGAGASAPVRCFSDAAERASFWQDLPVPTTRAEQRHYLAKTIALAQRCGEQNGALLAHISTADTARDLNYLRRLVGDQQLTYFGESFGTLIGQTYANLFPHRVRAMALDGLIDSVASAAGAEAVAASSLADTDRVYHQFLRLCQAAGPGRCALAGHGPVAPRVNRLLNAAAPPSDPRPLGRPARGAHLRRGVDRPQAGRPARPESVARGRSRAGGGHPRRRLAGRDHRQGGHHRPSPDAVPGAGRGAGVRRQPRPPPRRRLAAGGGSPGGPQPHRRTDRGLASRPVRVLAGLQRRPLHRPLERHHPQSDPGHRHPVRPQHAAAQRSAGRASGWATRSC